MTAHHENSRRIREHIYISGKLELLTPTHFGGGEDAFRADMTLLKDDVDGRALIPGASVAGALRNYLRERILGYAQEELADDSASVIAWLFGPVRTSRV